MQKHIHKKEIDLLYEFLSGDGGEKAKNHLVYPLFHKLFGTKFKKETDASDSDIYIEGKLVVELKSDYNDVLKGFHQALHYEKKDLDILPFVSFHLNISACGTLIVSRQMREKSLGIQIPINLLIILGADNLYKRNSETLKEQ